MTITDYQPVITMLTSVMTVAFPIALMFLIVQKIVSIFLNFVFGKDVNF